MNVFWGLIIAAIGLLFVFWGRNRSTFVIYRLLVARSRIMWGDGDRVHFFYQASGVVMVLFGTAVATLG